MPTCTSTLHHCPGTGIQEFLALTDLILLPGGAQASFLDTLHPQCVLLGPRVIKEQLSEEVMLIVWICGLNCSYACVRSSTWCGKELKVRREGGPYASSPTLQVLVRNQNF